MKKFALVAVVFSMVAGLVACSGGGGSAACDDYLTKAKGCACDPLTDATAKAACEKQYDDLAAGYEAAGGDVDAACKAASDALTASGICK